jgi:diguanylate cyclase (GGDEF)-like protein/PAS domain S-box-containing protein
MAQAAAEPRDFQALVEEIPAVTYIADFVGEFTLRYVSPQCEAILGYRPQEWVGDPDAWVRALHPGDRERIVAAAQECIARQVPFDFEYRMLTAAGAVKHIWEKTSIVRDPAGQPVAVNGVMLDVTELKQAEEALEHQAHEREAERAQYEAALRRQLADNAHQALHDDLTGLPNRRQLNLALDAAAVDGRPHILLLLDLDRFKDVNDVLGHHYGDELLRQAARRFGSALRSSDVLARLGGDEFAVLLGEARRLPAAARVARRLIDVLAEPFLLDEVPVYVEASIGIAASEPSALDRAAILRHADTAMYQAKRDGAGWRTYEAEPSAAPSRLSRLAELRTAISEGQLVLHYQPKLDVSRDRISGVEALVRWEHPELGLLAPSEFLPLAEQTGLIRPLTTFVVAEALGALRRWRDAGSDLTMAINIAPRSLADPGLCGEIAGQLAQHGIPPEALELEITETGLMHEPARSLQTLRSLHAIGVKLAIDDFGTGFSSLARLRDLPVDHLKIDRTFVTAMDSDLYGAQIVKSTIALGQSLGMLVVAEGVEDGEVLTRLSGYGCDAAQGYHIGRPMPAGDLALVLAARALSR